MCRGQGDKIPTKQDLVKFGTVSRPRASRAAWLTLRRLKKRCLNDRCKRPTTCSDHDYQIHRCGSSVDLSVRMSRHRCRRAGEKYDHRVPFGRRCAPTHRRPSRRLYTRCTVFRIFRERSSCSDHHGQIHPQLVSSTVDHFQCCPSTACSDSYHNALPTHRCWKPLDHHC